MNPSPAKGQRIGYVRVSSAGQNTGRQLEGVPLDRVFTDHPSGKDTARPQLEATLAFAHEGELLFVHSMDKLPATSTTYGRSSLRSSKEIW